MSGVDGFQGLLAELAQIEARTIAAAEGQSGAGGNQQVGRIAAQLLGELLNAAPLVTVATAIANAVEAGHTRLQRRAIAIYAPVRTASPHKLVERMLDTDADLDVCSTLQNYCARLSFAVRMSRAGDDGIITVPEVDIEILADAWRRAAGAATDAIEALAAIAKASPDSRLLPALSLLQLAESGETPCIEADGRVTIPGWAERRREKRVSVQLAATAQIGRQIVPAMIRDVSPSGLGLQCTYQGAPEERITVRLPGDRQMSGTIAWADGQRIGMMLDQRLEAGDPLLGA